MTTSSTDSMDKKLSSEEIDAILKLVESEQQEISSRFIKIRDLLQTDSIPDDVLRLSILDNIAIINANLTTIALQTKYIYGVVDDSMQAQLNEQTERCMKLQHCIENT